MLGSVKFAMSEGDSWSRASFDTDCAFQVAMFTTLADPESYECVKFTLESMLERYDWY